MDTEPLYISDFSDVDGYYAKGHVDIAEFVCAVKAEWQDVLRVKDVRHGWWRWMPVNHGADMIQHAATPGKQGAFRVTYASVYERDGE